MLYEHEGACVALICTLQKNRRAELLFLRCDNVKNGKENLEGKFKDLQKENPALAGCAGEGKQSKGDEKNTV